MSKRQQPRPHRYPCEQCVDQEQQLHTDFSAHPTQTLVVERQQAHPKNDESSQEEKEECW